MSNNCYEIDGVVMMKEGDVEQSMYVSSYFYVSFHHKSLSLKSILSYHLYYSPRCVWNLVIRGCVINGGGRVVHAR